MDFVDFVPSEGFGDFADFEKPDTDKLPHFPTESLPPIIGNYAHAVAESLQVSEDMAAVAILGIVSLSVMGSFYIEPKTDWIEPLNLYILITARPSERKTPVLKEVSAPVYEYAKEENERRRPLYDKYLTQKKILENRINDLIGKASKGAKGKEPVTMQDVFDAQQELSDLKEVTLLKLIIDDITPEAMVKVMKENDEKIAMVTAEGGIFGMLAGRYSAQPNMDIFLKAYGGEPYCSDRMGRAGEALEHPLLSLLLMVQPKVLQDALENPDFRERGFMARFLYSLPPSKVGYRIYDSKPIPKEVRAAYNQLIKELLSIGIHREWQLENTVIHFSDEAYQASKEFFDEIEEKIPEDYEEIEDWVGKYHGQTMRIAGLLHVIKHRLGAANIILEAQTMKEAIQIGRYFLEHAQMSFSLSGLTESKEVKDAKYIMKKIDSFYTEINSQNPQNPQNLRFRDLHYICKGHFKTKEDMQPGIDELIQRNFIRIERKQTGKSGRPSEIVEVNSEYWIRKVKKNIEAKKRRKEIEVGHAEKRIMDKI